MGRDCYVSFAFSEIPNTKHGQKIRSGYLTPTFWGAQKGAGLRRNPCILRGPQPQARRENYKWLPHPCLPRGSKRGRDCYITCAFWEIPNTKHGEKIRSGYLTRTFLGAQKGAALRRNPCILGGPQHQARGENQKWIPHPCFPGGPKRGGIAM